MANWHQLRKRVHLGCSAIFLVLPFLNVIRFDIPRQRFYFFGYELWINEFGIIFFALMFLMFAIVVSSVLFGRVYCGYLCPQMIFSEASRALESRLGRQFRSRPRLGRAIFYGVVGVASVFLAFVFISYFVEPRDLARRLARLDIHTAAGISGAAVTLLTFLDFSFLRLRFCTTACPYGYLQGMLADGNTLLVQYRDEQHACIECKKCVRDCPMGIDIRQSPFQIECVHCGECIDSCETILARLKKPGLIRYAWGEADHRPKGPVPVDAKRVILTAVLLLYGMGLFVSLSMRHAVLVRVAPERAQLYHAGADGRVYNDFRYSIANRSRQPAMVAFSLDYLPGATMNLASNPVAVKPGESVQGNFQISAPAAGRTEFVTHFSVRATNLSERVEDNFPMTFISPTEAP